MSHIAFILPGVDRLAGAERQVMLLAGGLQGRGWRVTVIALSGSGGKAAKELENHGVAFVSLGMQKGLADPRGWLRFHRWLRDHPVDIVHAHLPHAIWFARLSRLGAKIPLLVDTVHTSSTGGWFSRISFRLTDSLSEAVTAVSMAAARAHVNAGMADPDKVTVMPNCVNMQQWQTDAATRAEARRKLGVRDEFVWLAAGRLHPVKDYATLLKAMKILPASSRLLIAGQGPLDVDLKRLCASLGIENRVRFLGFQHELHGWMQAADAFVLCSLWEGLPVSLLEAAASGLPAIATDVRGTREAVVPGETAWLVSPGDPAELAGAMTAMMNLPPRERAEMGERARRLVREKFSLEMTLDRWEEFYASLRVTAICPTPLFAPDSSSERESSTSVR